MPATIPGIPAAIGPFSERPLITFPFLSRYIFFLLRKGAVSRPSINTCLLSKLRWSNQNPPPPKPDPYGSTTASDAVIAAAASNALPPYLSISNPVRVAIS